MKRVPFGLVAVGAVALAVIPYPGRWKLLQQLLPVAVVVSFYWGSDYSIPQAGLGRPRQGWWGCLAQAVMISLGLYALKALVLKPILQGLFEHDKDLSLFEPMRGSLPTLFLYLTFMWILAAFGEEFLWRGFLLREIGERASVRYPWVLGVATSSVFFALAHAYQGPYGVAEKLVWAAIVGGIYVWSGRRDIWLVVLVHGIQNTISFVRIYLGS